MSDDLMQQINDLVKKSLDEAETIWNQTGQELEENFSCRVKAASLNSRIPGYSFVIDGQPKVDDFIAIAVDLRESTKHLMNAISSHITEVNQEQRLFFETSALLPAMAKLVDEHKGKTTEYPGDGILGLFRIDALEPKAAIYDAYHAARDCLEACSKIINPELSRRYSLPEISIGVGLGKSKAIVTLIGYEGFRQPKAIGKCVYYATKLAKGNNEICIDKALHLSWPKTENGHLYFKKLPNSSVEGYVIARKSE